MGGASSRAARGRWWASSQLRPLQNVRPHRSVHQHPLGRPRGRRRSELQSDVRSKPAGRGCRPQGPEPLDVMLARRHWFPLSRKRHFDLTALTPHARLESPPHRATGGAAQDRPDGQGARRPPTHRDPVGAWRDAAVARRMVTACDVLRPICAAVCSRPCRRCRGAVAGAAATLGRWPHDRSRHHSRRRPTRRLSATRPSSASRHRRRD